MVKGEVYARIISKTVHGEKVQYRRLGENLVVDIGENMLANLLAGNQAERGFVEIMDLGTGTTSPSETDTSLESGLGVAKATTYAASGSVVDFTASWGPAEANAALTELGLFSSGQVNMFNRLVFSAINKQSGQTLDMTCKVTFE